MQKKSFIIFTLGLWFSLCAAKKVCTISIPKCGTHMLIKLIYLINNQSSYRAGLALTEDEMHSFNIVSSHAIFNQHNLNLYHRFNPFFSFIFIYRDLRDQVVSMAHWLRRTGQSKESLESLIFSLIADVKQFYYNPSNVHAPENQFLTDINSLYHMYLPWMSIPGFYITTFEKLVGPKGGGNAVQQYQEIDNIARHMGIILTPEQIENIVNNLFGESGTFREGKIGSWKTSFTPKHKELFKKHGGQLLIDLGYEKDLNW